MADTRTFPEVDFISKSADEIFEELVSYWENEMGRTLHKADPIRLMLGWEAAIDAQLYAAINLAAKRNVPRYAYGDYLDSIAENYYYGLTRLPASAATTTMRFTLSAESVGSTVIPVGTKVTQSGEVLFATTETVEVADGETYADVTAECTQTGTIGNGFDIGTINVCVDNDNVINLLSVSNLTVSEGGAAAETDESFYERMRESLSAYSTAGAEKAYIYHAKSASALVGGVKVMTPQPGYVTLYFVRTDGTIPGEELIGEVQDYLDSETIRPLTDHLTVAAPTAANFDINFTWYRENDSVYSQEELEAKVESALTEYIEWQTTEIGRDINPSMLIYFLMQSDIKRVNVVSPSYTVVSDSQVAQLGSTTATYGGSEDG